MTNSDLEDALRRGLRGIAAEVETAPDLEERIAQRRSARRIRRSHRIVAGVSAAALAGVAAIAMITVSATGHPQRVITVSPPLQGTSTTTLDPGAGGIADGRFTGTVTLDGGILTIRPTPPSMEPAMDQAQAKILVGPDIRAYGSGWTGAVGFGRVSISPSLAPGVENVPAWVGIIKLPGGMCPEYTSLPPPGAQRGLSYLPGYLAVIVEGTGTKVLDYYSRSQECDWPARGPSVDDATQVVSIPWQLVSLHGQIITIRYQDPACDPDHGVDSVDLGGNTQTEQGHVGVFIKAPYSLTYHDLLTCGGPWSTETYNYGIGLGPGAPPALRPIVVTHDPTGPVGNSS